MTLLWKMRFILKAYWKQYLLAFVCLQTVAILNQLPPWLIGRVVDEITTDSLTGDELWMIMAGILISAVAIYGLRYVWRALLYGASVNIVREQRDLLFQHLTRMSPAFYHRHTTGDLMAHATNDLNAVEDCAGGGIMTLIDSFIAGFTVLAAMIFVVSGKLTLWILIPFPALIWATSRYGILMHERFGKAQESFSALNEEARETVSGIRAVRAHQLNNRQHRRFHEQSRNTLDANRRVARVDALFIPSVQIFFGLAFVIALMGGAWLIQGNEMTIGMLTTFTLYLGQLLSPMMQLGWQFSIFQRGSASWNRLEKLFAQKPEVTDQPDATEAPASHDLRFAINSFNYPDSERPVLEDIHFNAPAGSFIGITGRTGSGKSSLFRVLLREFNLQDSSSITLGNQPIESIKLHALRDQFAWVPQEPMLFSGSIARNIALSNPDATQAEIEKAAKQAAIHDEIMAFQNGYETLLGEHGINLSGGQKQRVAFARALLADAPILLLDDAFSALDMKTEATILKNLASLHSKTILLITQRLPELIKADHILVIEEGRIVEQGTHGTLLGNEGWYARIYRQQARTLQLQDFNQQVSA
ncbi:ABC transporter ATP-binding protein [Parendozoicomonas haliclonae]|uniref:Multidrug resistance-like ATP-binding protein MdlA n=1 Tax=Parendozoicomonas haliclonae TaxID=1960125 RepID=A0A1X7AIN0_9GAMM|nr:ABC transporter transmembrane domain-containing protein [Parendozoicomonas haliclonae]SMA43952.1 putative multidrug resistance ABC transporter ATP-binding/permease protein YheI [Parendozoicomonas haliclonae]